MLYQTGFFFVFFLGGGGENEGQGVTSHCNDKSRPRYGCTLWKVICVISGKHKRTAPEPVITQN